MALKSSSIRWHTFNTEWLQLQQHLELRVVWRREDGDEAAAGGDVIYAEALAHPRQILAPKASIRPLMRAQYQPQPIRSQELLQQSQISGDCIIGRKAELRTCALPKTEEPTMPHAFLQCSYALPTAVSKLEEQEHWGCTNACVAYDSALHR